MLPQMRDERLILFVKAPRPGQVKTRLAVTLGEAAACAAYERLVKSLLSNLASLSEVEFRFTPDDAGPEIQPWLRPGWTARGQGIGDLGRRLRSAFADAFAGGAKRVVIIGSDCPEVTVSDVREAWRELRTRDLVVGPAVDGGYWLIGLREPQPALFENIPWSSESVLAETLRRARSQRLKMQLLRILEDVDDEPAWREFLKRAPGP